MARIRQNGGFVGKINNTTTSGASGIFGPNELQYRRLGGLWPNVTATAAAQIPDEYFEYTTLLLPGNGTIGAHNNAFLDSSAANGGSGWDITRNGNPTQGTFSPFSQTGWGYYVPEQVSNQVNFTTSAGTDFQFAGDFTIEGWVYAENNSGDGSVFVVSDNTNYLALNISISANVFNLYLNNSTPVVITSDIPLGTWTHVAMVRSGSGTGNIKLYTNGVLKGSTTNTSTLGYANPTICRIGGGVSGINRYYSNLRVCKSAVYTGAFTPSMLPLTTTSQSATNCVLLTANSNRFLNQAVGATATITGSPRVVAFSPFNPTASWSAATYGGSGYFDGSGDYLNSPSSSSIVTGTNSLTIEAWFYWSGSSTKFQIFGSSSNDFNSYVDATSVNLYDGTTGTSRSTTIIKNQWNHFALVRNGSTATFYINGNAVGATFTWSKNYSSAFQVLVGRNWTSGTDYADGYISDFRILNGTAATITVPTAPLTAITNTSLLLNFTNAGIYDATSKNDLETVGDARISTAISAKWGSGSMSFDGNGDYLLTNGATTDLFAFGSGAFTIEFWLYLNTTSGTPIIYDGRPSGTSTTQPTIFMNGAVITYFTNAANRITGSSLSTSIWYHIALSRSGTDTKLFVDGTQVGSTYSDSTSYTNSAARPLIGVDGVSGNTNYFNGYIQDLRITKGYARYTANFTPPTAAFPTL